MVKFAHPPELRAPALLAAVGLLVPALLTLFRGFVLRHSILGNLGAGFTPLAGPVGGIWPHSFYLVMHDLTHPLILIAYAAVFAWLPFYLRATISPRRRSLLAPCILIVHSAFVLSYLGSLHLPVGDMISTIRS